MSAMRRRFGTDPRARRIPDAVLSTEAEECGERQQVQRLERAALNRGGTKDLVEVGGGLEVDLAVREEADRLGGG